MDERKLSRVELFAFPAKTGCSVILKLSCGQEAGWGECVLPGRCGGVDLFKWSRFLRDIRRCTVGEAFLRTSCPDQRRSGPPEQLEMTRLALLDLEARQQGRCLLDLVESPPPLRLAAGAESADFSAYPGAITVASSGRTGRASAPLRHLHPGADGSLFELIHRARKLRSQGFALVLHRDGWIGPACSTLRLLADRLQARWYEKEEDAQPDALCPSAAPRRGTGFDPETALLIDKSVAYCSLL